MHKKDTFLMNELLQAIHQDHVQKIRSLIAAGADVNEIDPEKNQKPIFYAISTLNKYNVYQRSKIIDILVASGADINEIDPKAKRTPLMYTIEAAHRRNKLPQTTLLTVVTDLIAHGADVNIAITRGTYAHQTPLYTAIEAGYNEVATELLNARAALSSKNHPLLTLLVPGKHLARQYMARLTRDIRIEIAELLLHHASQQPFSPGNLSHPYIQTVLTFLRYYPTLPPEVLNAAQDVLEKELAVYRFYQAVIQQNQDFVGASLQNSAFCAILRDTSKVRDALHDTRITLAEPAPTAGQQRSTREKVPAWLTLAVAHSSLAIVEELYHHHTTFGWDINEYNETIGTPLHVAIQDDESEIASFLIAHGANVNIWTQPDKTLPPRSPLTLALLRQNVPLVQLLLQIGADVDPVTEQAPWIEGWQACVPLFCTQNSKTIQLLLDAGANPNWHWKQSGKTHKTVLEKAIFENDITTAHLLLKYGARFSGGEYDAALLQCVVERGDIPTLALLLEQEITFQGGEHDAALLRSAFGQNNNTLFQFLWDHGVRFSNSEKDCALLIEAIRQGKSQLVEFLLDKGIRPLVSNDLPKRPLPVILGILQRFGVELRRSDDLVDAIAWGNITWIQEVLDRQPALISEPVQKQKSLLYWALKYRQTEIAQMLITRGGWTNQRDQEICLYLAISQDMADIVHTFLTAKYTFNLNDYYCGDLLLHCAARNGSVRIVQSLLAAGADPSLRDALGATPLEEAEKVGQREVAHLLLAQEQARIGGD
jgi:ankyrin repeat protein